VDEFTFFLAPFHVRQTSTVKFGTHKQVALPSASQRGRAMLPVCLVSVNSTIPRAQSFLLVYRLKIDHCVQLNSVLLSSA